SAKGQGDPLLGPNPELMPALPPLPDEDPARRAPRAGAIPPVASPPPVDAEPTRQPAARPDELPQLPPDLPPLSPPPTPSRTPQPPRLPTQPAMPVHAPRLIRPARGPSRTPLPPRPPNLSPRPRDRAWDQPPHPPAPRGQALRTAILRLFGLPPTTRQPAPP